MQAERARIRRLQRLEKVRALAKRQATADSASAEEHLAQLQRLAAKTQAMLAEYRGRTSLTDGLELRQLAQFVTGLNGISAVTHGDAEQARQLADQKQQELAQAERRRAAVEDRIRTGKTALAQRLVQPVLGSRRAVGTGLE